MVAAPDLCRVLPQQCRMPVVGPVAASKLGQACQLAGMGPLWLCRLPLTSAADPPVLKGVAGMLARPRGMAAERLECLRVTVLHLRKFSQKVPYSRERSLHLMSAQRAPQHRSDA